MDELGNLEFVVLILGPHGGGESDEMLAVGAVGQLCLDVVLAAAEQDGPDALAEGCEVFIIGRTAFFIQLIEIAIEAEQRTQQRRIEKIDDGVELVDAVFDGGTGEDEGVAAFEAFHGLRGLGGPVFDALRFIKHDDVGAEVGVDVEAVGDDLLVVDDGEKRWFRVGVTGGAQLAMAVNEAFAECGEFPDLLLPLGLQRGRSDDKHAPGFSQMME